MPGIIQADRDRAALYYRTKRGGRILAQNIKEGYVDNDPVVEMLAAHRVQATLAERERAAKGDQ